VCAKFGFCSTKGNGCDSPNNVVFCFNSDFVLFLGSNLFDVDTLLVFGFCACELIRTHNGEKLFLSQKRKNSFSEKEESMFW
jgi:hypothetical protein